MTGLVSAPRPPATTSDPAAPAVSQGQTVASDRLYEVVDGNVVETPPMGASECELASLIAFAMNQIVQSQQRGKVLVELLFLLDAARGLKRRPDLAFVSSRKWPVRRRIPDGEAWDMVPDLAVEVVSESNSANEINAKLVDYFRAGVQQVWVIYRVSRQVYAYTALTQVQILAEPAELDGGELIPGFRLSLSELFGDVDIEPTAAATV